MEEYEEVANRTVKFNLTLNYLENLYHCCGLISTIEYNGDIHPSCCMIRTMDNCYLKNFNWPNSCHEKLSSFFNFLYLIIGICIPIYLLTQIISLLMIFKRDKMTEDRKFWFNSYYKQDDL